MLIEKAIGDAYGACFEYMPVDFVRQHNTLSGYPQHPVLNIKPGRYTDDTQMALALSEVLVSDKPWKKRVIADQIVECFKRDPREGYTSGLYQLLQEVESGKELLSRLVPSSDSSGAAMRSAPLGIISTMDEVMERAKVQASITHNTELGIKTAQAVALAAHYMFYGIGPKSRLGIFLSEKLLYDFDEPWQGVVGRKSWMCVRAVVTALKNSGSMSELLKEVVAFTGDTDTVAAIALAIGAHSEEIEQDLPKPLLDGLENDKYGMDYLKEMNNKLLMLSGRGPVTVSQVS